MANGKITLKQVAEKAGCSQAVASKVLNNSKSTINVSAATEKKVKDIALKLGYVADFRAQSLAKQEVTAIGLLLGKKNRGNIHTGFYGHILGGIDEGVRSKGKDLLVIGPSEQESEIDRGIRYLKEGRIGALVAAGSMYGDRLEKLGEQEIPLVIAIRGTDTCFPNAYLDYMPGMRKAVRHLKKLGHSEILWASHYTAGKESAPLRNKCFRKTCKEEGIGFREFRFDIQPGEGGSRMSEQIDFFRSYFKEHGGCTDIPSSVIAYNELMGMGIMRALADSGLSVPGDVSVIGFDNMFAELSDPPMTVIDLNFAGMGKAAAELAVEICESGRPVKEFYGKEVLVPAGFVQRSSTGKKE